MRLLAILTLLTLVACAPATVDETPAPGVTLTATEADEYTTYRLDVDPPVDRAFLRFHGDNLATNAEECDLVAGAIECVLGEVNEFYELHISGTIANSADAPYGVACRTECRAVFLTD